jgi:putative addiction module component (TIGR02574 family)
MTAEIAILNSTAVALAADSAVTGKFENGPKIYNTAEKLFKLSDKHPTLELSIPERIQLVEDIWDTITPELSSVALTKEEKEIIDSRLDAYYQDPSLGSPWDDVYKRIVGV